MYKLQDDVLKREQKIKEVTDDTRPLSTDKINAVTDRWNNLEIKCTNLNPVLQVMLPGLHTCLWNCISHDSCYCIFLY